MDWRTFCNFDRNISISESPLPVFWSKSGQRFTECGELIVSSPFLIASLISYFYLFSIVFRRLRSPSLSRASLSRRETASLCLKFFSSFGASICSITDLIFNIIYESPSPTPAALMTISGLLLSLFLSSLVWLTLICAYERIALNIFPSAFIGWLSCIFITSLRFYDVFKLNGWDLISVSSLTSLLVQFIYIISVIIFDYFCGRRRWSTVGLDDDEIAFLNSENRGEIRLGPGDERAGYLSKSIFYWTNILMKKGYRGQLTSTDELFSLPRSLNVQELEENFLRASRRRETLTRRFSLVKTLHSCFGLEFYTLGILKFFADALSFGGPILLGYLVNFMTEPNAYWWLGYVYAGSMLAASFLSATFGVHFNYLISKVGLKVRSVVITAVYGKLVRVPQVELERFSSGEMMNFMSTDSERVVNFCRSFHDFWSLPMQIGIALFLLYREVGLAFLAGVGFALLLIPINRWIALKIGNLSTQMMAQKDSRVKLMTELLFGIRIVKFGAWENVFTDRISAIRRSELKYLKGRKYLDALCVYMWACAPVVLAILTFGTYVLLGEKLTAAKVFTSIALFNILIFPLNAFPWVVSGVVEAWVSCKRLKLFFDLKEFEFSSYYNNGSETETDFDIELHDASFYWLSKQRNGVRSISIPETYINGLLTGTTATLRNLNFSVKKGQLIGVIGCVGSGKSSLLSAILGEIGKYEDGGSVFVRDIERLGVAYVSQEPWLQQGSVRQNILFGRPYQAELYDAVVTACALTSDFKQMPNGDVSELGEQGVTLSGGQRTRIALARAVYQNKSIYLLDDPLSAVDSHVARFLFHRCIRNLLYGKTVILVTHHISYLRQADVIIVVKNGCIEASGPPNEILSGHRQAVLSMVDEDVDSMDESNAGDDKTIEQPPESGEPVLVLEEEKESGTVKMQVYGTYIGSIGCLLAFFIFVSLFFMQSSKNISDWWLSFWVSHTENKSNNTLSNTSWLSDHFLVLDMYRHPYQLYLASSVGHSNARNNESNEDVDFYLKIYGIIIGSNTIFALFRAFLYAYGCICAAKVLHERIFTKILKATVRFFDTTPVGRLINRFSSDVYSIDELLPFQANRLVACLFGIIGTTATMCYGLPWFGLCVVPMALIYYFIQRYYRYTTCDLKRLSSTSLSPIYSHFTDTLNGLQTIRAFRATDRFLEQNRLLLTSNQRAQYSAIACRQWLAVRLQLMGVVMVGAVAVIAVLEHTFRTIDPGLAGLAISYALSITSLLGALLDAFTETEKEMVSVERVSDYIERAPLEKWSGTIPVAWPSHGQIIFSDVKLRYAPDLPLALNGVSFKVRPGEKIGIVGRTGSGKSSILQALFRTVELESGQIIIDDLNIAYLDLTALRSRLAIIPQTPFLFGGTVRQNLDVGQCYNDYKLHWAIEACHLDAVVSRLGGLDGTIGEKGSGLSLGEKQLFCLARALLANAKILCIDEATAHVDLETDTRIQSTLKKELPNSTVLTIAHRINTVIDYDRIIVMSEGCIVEIGAPKVLLQQTGSRFQSLANAVGI